MSGFGGFEGLGPLLGGGPIRSAVYAGPGSSSDPRDPLGLKRLLNDYERALREQLQTAARREAALLWAAQTRRYWSGPDKHERELLRVYRLPWSAMGAFPKSVFSDGYRQRQRARVKRRRR